MQEVCLTFSGPYAWLPDTDVPLVFEANVARAHGIYLRTVPTERGELVLHVGETERDFAYHLAEEFRNQLAGVHRLYAPDRLLAGEKDLVWGGMFGKHRESSLVGFIDRLPDLGACLQQNVRLARFHLAPMEEEPRIRRRIHAALVRHLEDQAGFIGEFIDSDIRVEARQPDERPCALSIRTSYRPGGMPVALTA